MGSEVPVAHNHVGEVTNERMLSLVYSAADLLVSASLAESFGLTVVEAMACGTPVVGFDVGGIPDMVRPGETGLLAPAGDTDALAAGIRRMLTDDELRRRLGARCREVAVKEYGLEIQARRYVALYEEMLKSVSR